MDTEVSRTDITAEIASGMKLSDVKMASLNLSKQISALTYEIKAGVPEYNCNSTLETDLRTLIKMCMDFGALNVVEQAIIELNKEDK